MCVRALGVRLVIYRDNLNPVGSIVADYTTGEEIYGTRAWAPKCVGDEIIIYQLRDRCTHSGSITPLSR